MKTTGVSGALDKEIMKHRCFKGFAGDESGGMERIETIRN
jgi:hypothetical protein